MRLVVGAPEAVIDDALGGGWGTPADVFDDGVRAAYLAQLRAPDRVHSICEEYRAAASIDREHDRADRLAGRRIAASLLALWSREGPLSTWYAGEGGHSPSGASSPTTWLDGRSTAATSSRRSVRPRPRRSWGDSSSRRRPV